MATVIDDLRNEPGIDVTRLQPGVRVMVETETAVYEMTVLRPDLRLLEVASSHPALHKPTTGQFQGSLVPNYGDQISDWIGKGLCLAFRFRNGNHISTPILSAEVRGATWHYTVF